MWDLAQRARQVGVCLKYLPSLPRPRRLRSDRETGERNGNGSTIEEDSNQLEEEEDDDNEESIHQPIPHFHTANVPWQRVINSRGMISRRYSSCFLFLFPLSLVPSTKNISPDKANNDQ